MPEPLVEVLMSTFNGERHIAQQVRSILEQERVRVRLTVRDDGSTDGTVDVLGELGVPVVDSAPLGLPRTFLRLIQDSDAGADLWALADQDDRWSPDKLARAAAALDGVRGPALYCARVLVTDADLRPLYLHPLPVRGPSFANALVQNIATGCTLVFNRDARDVLRDRWPGYAVMHDAWLYLVLSGTGTVIYDPTPVVHYRQHERNSVGMGRGPVSRVLGRVRRQLTPGGAGAHGRQNAELARTHSPVLSAEAQDQLAAFLASRRSVRARLGYAVRGAAHRQTRGSDLVLRVLLAAGRV